MTHNIILYTGACRQACKRKREESKGGDQKCTSKGIRRQGVVLKHRNSLQKSLCPAVIHPYLCKSEGKAPLHSAAPVARANTTVTITIGHKPP